MDNKVLATVNGVEITERDIQETIMNFPRERQSYFLTEQGKKQLLEQLISFELIHKYALDSKLEDDNNYLVQLNRLKKEVLTQYAIDKVVSEVKVDEEEVKKYYEANHNLFAGEEEVSAKHILVDTLEEANKIAKEISEGLNFEEAAMKYSKCPSKSQGGDLGSFTKGKMVPEFEQAAFKANIDEVTEPVKTQFGYHLINVYNKAAGDGKSYEEARNTIWNGILGERQKYRYSQFIEELKNKYKVEIK